MFTVMAEQVTWFYVCLVSDTDYLPFTRLRNTTNVVNKGLPPADDTTSIDIDIPFGLPFDNASQKTAYVSISMHASCRNVHQCYNTTGCNKWVLFLWPKTDFPAESFSIRCFRFLGVYRGPILERHQHTCCWISVLRDSH